MVPTTLPQQYPLNPFTSLWFANSQCMTSLPWQIMLNPQQPEIHSSSVSSRLREQVEYQISLIIFTTFSDTKTRFNADNHWLLASDDNFYWHPGNRSVSISLRVNSFLLRLVYDLAYHCGWYVWLIGVWCVSWNQWCMWKGDQ